MRRGAVGEQLQDSVEIGGRALDLRLEPRHRCREASRRERLHHIIDGAFLEGRHRILVIRGDEGDVALPARLAGDFESAHPRHLDVEKEDLRRVRFERVQRFDPIRRLGDDDELRPQLAQRVAELRQQDGLVFRNDRLRALPHRTTSPSTVTPASRADAPGRRVLYRSKRPVARSTDADSARAVADARRKCDRTAKYRSGCATIGSGFAWRTPKERAASSRRARTAMSPDCHGGVTIHYQNVVVRFPRCQRACEASRSPPAGQDMT